MPEMRPAYDERARERIRRALHGYKEQHAIGVPALQLRIAEAIGDGPDRIPIKSLQRFLAGTHRTEDALVHHCTEFLSAVAPPPVEEELGMALARFMPVAPDTEEQVQNFSGTYQTHIRQVKPGPAQAVPGSRGVVVDIKQRTEPGFSIPWSVLTLQADPELKFLRTSESRFILDQDAEPPANPASGAFTAYSGIFVPCGNKEYLILARSFLDVQLYFLSKNSEQPFILQGVAFKPEGMFHIPLLAQKSLPWEPAFEIRLTRGGRSEPGANG